MKIGEILLKSSPVPTKREMSKSEYNKLVDANAKLMDKIKVLEKKYTIMKGNAETLAKRNDKAIEYNKQTIEDIRTFYRPTEDRIYSGDTLIDIAKLNIEILKGEDKE